MNHLNEIEVTSKAAAAGAASIDAGSALIGLNGDETNQQMQNVLNDALENDKSRATRNYAQELEVQQTISLDEDQDQDMQDPLHETD